MGRNRFAGRETVRIEISDGDWIEVKKQLTNGDQARLNSRMYGRVDVAAVAGGAAAPGIDIEAMAIDLLEVWLTDWSFRDADDKPVALSRDAIMALDEETGEEVQGALAKHVQAYDRGKATPNGRPKRAARSA